MGKITRCLKAVFMSYNMKFLTLGSSLIYGIQKSADIRAKMKILDGPSIIWVWVFAVSLYGISFLGVHAARTKNKTCLKVFAGFMVIRMMVMVFFGIAVVVLKKQIIEKFQSEEVATEFMKDIYRKAMLQFLQKNLQCCGWTGAEDWGNDIPESCSCTPSYGQQETAKCQFWPKGFKRPFIIYSKPCSHALMYYVELGIKITLAIFSGFFFIALIGFIIAIKMIRQISRHERIGQLLK